jgi:hypothetical protein
MAKININDLDKYVETHQYAQKIKIKKKKVKEPDDQPSNKRK